MGYVIYRITKVVTPSNPDKNLREAMGKQMANVASQQDLNAYLNYLKKEAKVEILVKNPAEEKGETSPEAAK